MAKSNLPEGVKMLVARHAAVVGTEIGTKALGSMKKLTNADPSEAVFAVGDQFTIPAADVIEEAVIVSQLNGNPVPGIAVQTQNGEPKMLYISSMRKSVVEYEETEDGYQTKKDASGATITHHADSAIRKEIMGKATVGDIVESLAGRTFKVTSIMGPYKTSRLKAVYDNYGNRSYEVVGLRNTTIPVFEEVK